MLSELCPKVPRTSSQHFAIQYSGILQYRDGISKSISSIYSPFGFTSVQADERLLPYSSVHKDAEKPTYYPQLACGIRQAQSKHLAFQKQETGAADNSACRQLHNDQTVVKWTVHIIPTKHKVIN